MATNLLLWANSVLNESKHQLNEHKERLLTLGFGNVTIGEWPPPRDQRGHGSRGGRGGRVAGWLWQLQVPLLL